MASVAAFGTRASVSVADEVNAVRTGAGWIDRSARGRLVVRGNDRQAFLHNMLSNDVTRLKPGQGCRAELLDERAHVIADLRLYVDADAVLLDTEPGLAEVVKARLDKYVIMDDVTFEDVTTTTALVTVSGPRAADALAKAGGALLPEAPFEHRMVELAGAKVRVVRGKWTGAPDFDLLFARESLAGVTAALAGVTRVSAEAFDLLQLEAGLARQGGELDDVVALEARLEHEDALSLTKCYLGQEVIARIVGRGHVNRLLVGLVLDGAPPAPKSAISVAGKEIGHVVRAGVSPTLGKTIATAYVRREHSEPGAIVEVGGVPATVTRMPFVGGAAVPVAAC
jgi:folate-binding protein YgfZ